MSHGFVTPEEKRRLRELNQERLRIMQRVRAEEKRRRGPPVQKAGQEPRQRDNDHLKRIRRLPCLATLIRENREVYGVEAAHVRANYPVPGWGGNPGLSRKPHDWRCLPASAAEHRLQHSMSEVAYWDELCIDPPLVCFALRDCETFEEMLAVIRAAAVAARERRKFRSGGE